MRLRYVPHIPTAQIYRAQRVGRVNGRRAEAGEGEEARGACRQKSRLVEPRLCVNQ